MSKRRFTSVTRGIHDFGELGSHMGMEKQLWELWDMRSLQISASIFPFPIWGSRLRPSKQQRSMVRKKASGMETPYS